MGGRLARTAAICVLLLVAIAGAAGAQSGFTGPPPGAEVRENAAPGLIERAITAIRVYQQRFYRELGAAIKELRDSYSREAAAGLVFIAFVYGIFHAAGPGHGKAVIAAYMLANERSVRRGIALAALASLAQAVTAIVAVYGLVLILGATGRRATVLAGDLEVVSYAMITAVGLWLLWRAAWPALRPLWRPAHAHAAADDGPESHGAHGDQGAHGGHHHHGGQSEHCGHVHIPPPALLDRPLTVATALPIIASIGLRPCSGAIVVLIFAHTLGLYGAGVAAAFAMAVGTAATVAALASLAVGSREFAAWAIGRDSRHAAVFYRVVAIAGALVVTALGMALLHAALTAPARPFT